MNMGQAQQNRRAVLIVEDDAELRGFAARLLEDGELDTIECESAEAALATMLIRGREVAMIFADIRLPGVMDGIDLAREVRLRCPFLPIILTSGHPPEGQLPLGVDFMPKPWQLLNLLVAAIVCCGFCRSCGYGSFRCCGRFGGHRRVTAKLKRPFSSSLAKSQPEKSKATSDNEGDPAHPHWYRPVPDDDGPLHENPHQVEQRHHGEDHPSHKRKRFFVHESSSQGAAVANVERTNWLLTLRVTSAAIPQEPGTTVQSHRWRGGVVRTRRLSMIAYARACFRQSGMDRWRRFQNRI
jgi:CheY-like chemotaxis protein